MKSAALGVELIAFLKSFEGAAAQFSHDDEVWSLWLPEVDAGDHPVTPASQVCFPVILRSDSQAIAVRFFYDCSTGKVRYYTGAVPPQIVTMPEFENAISELFRHSLPVEPIRQRKLRRLGGRMRLEKPVRPRRADQASLADPAEPPAPPPATPQPASVPRASRPATARILTPPSSKPKTQPLQPVPSQPIEMKPVPASGEPALTLAPSPMPAPQKAEEVRQVRIEIGERMRSVLLAAIVTLGLLVLVTLGVITYLHKTQDPGVLHHRMQLEALRMRSGR